MNKCWKIWKTAFAAVLLILGFGCHSRENQVESEIASLRGMLSLTNDVSVLQRNIGSVLDLWSSLEDSSQRKSILEICISDFRKDTHFSSIGRRTPDMLARRMLVAGTISQMCWQSRRSPMETWGIILDALEDYGVAMEEWQQHWSAQKDGGRGKVHVNDTLRRLRADRDVFAREYIDLSAMKDEFKSFPLNIQTQVLERIRNATGRNPSWLK